MVYGELGIYPLEIDIKARMISFWTNLLDFNSNKLSTMIYPISYSLNELGKCKSYWIRNTYKRNDINKRVWKCVAVSK